MTDYQNNSCLSGNLIGCSPKRHVKQRTLGASVIELNPSKDTLQDSAGHATSPSAVKWAARIQCGYVYESTSHYKKRSCLRLYLLGCRPKRHGNLKELSGIYH